MNQIEFNFACQYTKDIQAVYVRRTLGKSLQESKEWRKKGEGTRRRYVSGRR